MLRQLKRTPVLIALVLVTVGAAYALAPVMGLFTSADGVPAAPSKPIDPLVAADAVLADEAAGFMPAKVGFAVQFKDEVSPYKLMSLFAMPSETVELEAVFTEGAGSAEFAAEAGRVEQTAPDAWAWTAPAEPGLYTLAMTDVQAGETIRLHAFVKRPYDGSDVLNGYRIGQYEREPYRNNPVYRMPEGFIEVTPELADVPVSPHFTLGQFLCKQESGWPKYTLIRERLLLKLEMLLEEVNDRGVEAATFHVMSAFRTPFYNKSIGNRTSYSVHLYGGAADIFVDTDADTYMDDLTDDGDVTTADAQWMAAIVEGQVDETWYQPFVGGLGIYSPASHRGPFIHVDVRGERARW